MQVQKETMESLIDDRRLRVHQNRCEELAEEEFGHEKYHNLATECTEEEEKRLEAIWTEIPQPKVVPLGSLMAEQFGRSSSSGSILRRYEVQHQNAM